MKERPPFNYPEFIRDVARIAVPVALQHLLTTTGSMIDTVMLGRLGENTVGAVGLCAQFSSLMFSSYWGFIGGGMLFMSQYWGAKDENGLRKAYGITLTLCALVGLLFSFLAVAAPGAVLSLYTDKEVIREIGIRYLRVAGMAYILQCLAVAMSTLLRSTHRVKLPLYAGIASVCTNCVCNYILIFGAFGAPKMGVVGAAWGTVIAQALNLFIIIVYGICGKVPFLLEFRKIFHFEWEFIKEFFRKCFPILINEMAMGISTMLINIVLGRQSAPAIAAVAVYRTIEGLCIAFFGGFFYSNKERYIVVQKCTNIYRILFTRENICAIIYV